MIGLMVVMLMFLVLLGVGAIRRNLKKYVAFLEGSEVSAG